MNTKKPYHHGSLKQALIAAGIEILDARGLEALSLRAIAAHVGVSHTAPKNHFGSLKGLLTAIATEGFTRHVAYMRPAPQPDEPAARLVAAMQGYTRFASDHPHLFRLMFSPALCSFDDPDLSRAAGQSYGVLQDVAQAWQGGDIGPNSPCSDVQREVMLWSLVHGFATLRLSGILGRGAQGALDISDIMPAFAHLQKRTAADQSG